MNRNTPKRYFLFNEYKSYVQIFYSNDKHMEQKIENVIEGCYIIQNIFSMKVENIREIERYLRANDCKLGVFEDKEKWTTKNYFMITDWNSNNDKLILISTKSNIF